MSSIKRRSSISNAQRVSNELASPCWTYQDLHGTDDQLPNPDTSRPRSRPAARNFSHASISIETFPFRADRYVPRAPPHSTFLLTAPALSRYSARRGRERRLKRYRDMRTTETWRTNSCWDSGCAGRAQATESGFCGGTKDERLGERRRENGRQGAYGMQEEVHRSLRSFREVAAAMLVAVRSIVVCTSSCHVPASVTMSRNLDLARHPKCFFPSCPVLKPCSRTRTQSARCSVAVSCHHRRTWVRVATGTGTGGP